MAYTVVENIIPFDSYRIGGIYVVDVTNNSSDLQALDTVGNSFQLSKSPTWLYFHNRDTVQGALSITLRILDVAFVTPVGKPKDPLQEIVYPALGVNDWSLMGPIPEVYETFKGLDGIFRVQLDYSWASGTPSPVLSRFAVLEESTEVL